MTTGSWDKGYARTARRSWPFGGWGTPTVVFTKSWSGLDGKDKINNYDCTYQYAYPGISYGRSAYSNGSCMPASLTRAAYYCFTFPYKPPVAGRFDADLPAANKLIDKILQHDFNLSVSVAEGKEALRYIGQKLTKIATSLKHLKKGDLKRALWTLGFKGGIGKLIDSLPSYWLQYRYAIMPIVYDVNGALEYLESLQKPRSLKVKARSRVPLALPTTERPYMGTTRFWQNRRFWTSTQIGVTLDPTVDYNGIEFSNPYTVAWELTPFSFIVDWILPIGDYLRARWFFNYASYSDGYIARYTRWDTGFMSHYYDGTNADGYGNCVTGGDLLRSREWWLKVERRKWSGSIPKASIRNPLSRTSHYKRVVDLASLIATRGSSLRNSGRYGNSS